MRGVRLDLLEHNFGRRENGDSFQSRRTATCAVMPELVIMNAHEKDRFPGAIIELIETDEGVERAVVPCAFCSLNIVAVV